MSKYNRTYHLPFSPGTTNDDRISKDVESLLGIEVVITEKLDGENCGITKPGVYARSHATFTTSAWSREVRVLHDILKHDLSEGEYLFGENMEGIHSIEYLNLTSYFYLFGIKFNDSWYSWKEIEEYSFILNIPTVPVLFKGIIKDYSELKNIVENLVIQESSLGGKREGIVIRNAARFDNEDFSKNVMKWVRKGHVQTDEHWTKNWKKAKIKR
jgi:hypothetical protein